MLILVHALCYYYSFKIILNLNNKILNKIIEHVKPPEFEKSKPFAMLSTLLYADSFLGRSLVGKITQGTAKANQAIKAINLNGEIVDEGRLTKIFRYEGTKKVPIEIGEAGDIVVVAGLAVVVVRVVVGRAADVAVDLAAKVDLGHLETTLTLHPFPPIYFHSLSSSSTIGSLSLLQDIGCSQICFNSCALSLSGIPSSCRFVVISIAA